MNVLNRSLAECTASLTIAILCANIPANNLKAVSARFTPMLTADTRYATLARACTCSVSLFELFALFCKKFSSRMGLLAVYLGKSISFFFIQLKCRMSSDAPKATAAGTIK